MNDIEISVIITTYKRKIDVFERAFNSVLNQCFKNWELIVIDDNESNTSYRDDIEMFMSRYENNSNIKYIKNNKNEGSQKSRNRGIKSSIGKYIAFLDDDDEWVNDKLKKQIEVFRHGKENIGLVYCSAMKYSSDINKDNGVIRAVSSKGWIFKELLDSNLIGSTSFPLIKRECFEKCGIFDVELPAKQDYDMWLRISKYYEIDYVDDVLVNYFDHGGERISNNYEKKLQAEILFLHKYIDDIKNDVRIYSNKLRLISKYYYYSGKQKEAIKTIKQAINMNKLNIKLYLYLLKYRLNM